MSIKGFFLSALPLSLSVACSVQSAAPLERVHAANDVAQQPSAPGNADARTTPAEALETDEALSLLTALQCTGKPCVAPKAFVRALCSKRNPNAAVALFAADAPLQRRFIRVKEVDSMNPLGPSSSNKLTFDEEVVVLDGNASEPSKMSLSGANGHNVLRFDGTCASVMEDELTTKRPPAPRYAPLTWSHLDASIQEALLANSSVKKARHAQRSSCAASSFTTVDARCLETRARLADAIAVAIQTPMSLPDVRIR